MAWCCSAREPVLWLAMSFVYLSLAILLSQIPFIGWLILVLFTPLCMLGALSLAHTRNGLETAGDAMPSSPDVRAFRPGLHYLRDLLTRAARRLFSGFKEEDRLLPIMVISTLLLGGVVVIKILAQLLKVGGAPAGDTGGQRGADGVDYRPDRPAGGALPRIATLDGISLHHAAHPVPA